jgi:hypothetical protein
MAPRRVRASELAAFTFCKRAWYYSQTGAPQEERPLVDGAVWHEKLEIRRHRSLQLMQIGSLLVLGGVALIILSSLR